MKRRLGALDPKRIEEAKAKLAQFADAATDPPLSSALEVVRRAQETVKSLEVEIPQAKALGFGVSFSEMVKPGFSGVPFGFYPDVPSVVPGGE